MLGARCEGLKAAAALEGEMKLNMLAAGSATALSLAALAGPVHARVLYFAYPSVSGPTESGYGTITIGPLMGGQYDVTGVTGTAETSAPAGGLVTSAITGLSDYANADNIAYRTPPVFDFQGVSF